MELRQLLRRRQLGALAWDIRDSLLILLQPPHRFSHHSGQRQ